MVKIYLSPSNQPANLYTGVATSEKVEMEDLAIKMENLLKAYDGVEVVRADYQKSIVTRPKEAKEAGCDLYLAIHSNAGSITAAGAVALFHPSQPSMELLGKAMVKELDLTRDQLTRIESNRVTPVYSGMEAFNGYGYQEIREPYRLGMRTLLVEVDYHSNPLTARYIVSHKQEIAQAMVNVLVKTYNLQKKESEKKYLYKVQVGAFSSYERAMMFAKDLEADGYPVYIKKEEA